MFSYKFLLSLILGSCLLLTACSNDQQNTNNHFQHEEQRNTHTNSFHICFL